jgi:hypothetical protein
MKEENSILDISALPLSSTLPQESKLKITICICGVDGRSAN